MVDSWQIVVQSIESGLQDCLAKIGGSGVAPASEELKEFTSAKNAALQQTINNNLGLMENALEKNRQQFNITASEMDAVSDDLRTWIARANQGQEKVTSMLK